MQQKQKKYQIPKNKLFFELTVLNTLHYYIMPIKK